jgi:hypothetical protein
VHSYSGAKVNKNENFAFIDLGYKLRRGFRPSVELFSSLLAQRKHDIHQINEEIKDYTVQERDYRESDKPIIHVSAKHDCYLSGAWDNRSSKIINIIDCPNNLQVKKPENWGYYVLNDTSGYIRDKSKKSSNQMYLVAVSNCNKGWLRSKDFIQIDDGTGLELEVIHEEFKLEKDSVSLQTSETTDTEKGIRIKKATKKLGRWVKELILLKRDKFTELDWESLFKEFVVKGLNKTSKIKDIIGGLKDDSLKENIYIYPKIFGKMLHAETANPRIRILNDPQLIMELNSISEGLADSMTTGTLKLTPAKKLELESSIELVMSNEINVLDDKLIAIATIMTLIINSGTISSHMSTDLSQNLTNFDTIFKKMGTRGKSWKERKIISYNKDMIPI